LPPYSPELNPVEGLWDQVQDVTCNRHFTSLDELETALTAALRPFWETPARALSLVHRWLHSKQTLRPETYYQLLIGNGINSSNG
jgi:transposase